MLQTDPCKKEKKTSAQESKGPQGKPKFSNAWWSNSTIYLFIFAIWGHTRLQ